MSNGVPTAKSHAYDLEERTARFGEAVIDFAKQLPRNAVTIPLIGQLVRAATSIGANYCEADCAESRKDFEHKIGLCKKEANETKHWLRMISRAVPETAEGARWLWQEAHELQLIFVTIVTSSRARASAEKREKSLEIGN